MSKKKIEMRKFCRIIELPETQCLLMVRYDDESDDDDAHKLDLIFSFDGAMATMSLGFSNEQKAYNALDNFSYESVLELYQNQKDLIG